jgi:hypothetical protein
MPLIEVVHSIMPLIEVVLSWFFIPNLSGVVSIRIYLALATALGMK